MSNDDSQLVAEVSAEGVVFPIVLPHAGTDYIQGKIATSGTAYEAGLLAALTALVGPGDLVLDVGANIGNHSLYLMHVSGCSVDAFEPNRELADALIKSAEIGNVSDRLEVHAVAVGSAPHRGRFATINNENLGAQSVAVDDKAGDFDIVRIDDLALGRPVRLIKIDVEGMELDVLLGAERLIGRDRPTLVVECATLASFDVIAEWMDTHGYGHRAVFNATPTHIFRPVAEDEEELNPLLLAELRSYYGKLEQIAELQGSRDTLALKARAYGERIESLKAEQTRLAGILDSRAAQVSALQVQLAEARQAAATADEVHRSLVMSSERLQSQLAQEEAARASAEAQQRDLATKLADLEARLASTEAERRELMGLLAAERAAGAALAEKLTDSERNARGLHASLEIAQREISRQSALVVDRDRQVTEVAAAGRELRTELERERISREEAARAQARKLADTQRALERERARHQNLRNSRSNRLARTVRAGLSKPSLLVRLPWDLARALQPVPPVSPKPVAARRKQTRVASPEGAATHRPGLDGLVAPPERLITTVREQMGLHDALLAERSVSAATSAAAFKSRVVVGGRLRVAALVSPDVLAGLDPECDLLDLAAVHGFDTIDTFGPDLLLVEGRSWDQENSFGQVGRTPGDVRRLVEHCRSAHVVTAIWDTAGAGSVFESLDLAREFDVLYTVDIDSIPIFRTALGHSRVHLLPAACQPLLASPVSSDTKRDACLFVVPAQARTAADRDVVRSLARDVSKKLPVHIWGGSLGIASEYGDLGMEVLGVLAETEVREACRDYRFVMSPQPTRGSQTAISAATLDILSSGTVAIGNYARGLSTLLGDLVPAGDGIGTRRKKVAPLLDDNEAYDRLRASAMRRVHSAHTYAERLAYVVASITDVEYHPTSPGVCVVLPVNDRIGAERAIALVRSQVQVDVRPVFVTNDDAAAKFARDQGAVVLRTDAAVSAQMSELAQGTLGVALFHPEDWYGPTYLVDLLLAWTYSSADVVGKARWATFEAEKVSFLGDVEAYSITRGLEPRRSVISLEAAGKIYVADLLEGRPELLAEMDQLSVDRFDYLNGGARATVAETEPLDGGGNIDAGLPIASLHARARLDGSASDDLRRLAVANSAGVWEYVDDAVEIDEVAHGLRFCSTRTEPGPTYRWLTSRIPVSEIWQGGQASLRLDYDGDLLLMAGVRFFDESGKVLHSLPYPARTDINVDIPEGTEEVAFGIRVAGAGEAILRSFSLTHSARAAIIPRRRSTLLITQQYPTYENLYRNAFVHKRVLAYQDGMVDVDVFQVKDEGLTEFYEFEGVEVVNATVAQLRNLIRDGAYETILVHFLNESIWEAVSQFGPSHRIAIWVHGYEVQPWWRRSFLFPDEKSRAKARDQSEARIAFWRRVVDSLQPRTTLVFVSEIFARNVMRDLKRELPESQQAVIHNPIDTDLFSHVPKTPQARKRILSIRPYTSVVYGNDLAVQAVLRLSKEPLFADLEFLFVGDGPLFEETLAPLREFANVEIRRGFVRQEAIAELHKDYGIFLVPSRMDSQGVSRDEAMSSGLVPVTNRVAAIPEFVSDAEGYLAPSEDHRALAAAIVELYQNPDLFLQKSRASASRIRRQTAATKIFEQELAVIRELGPDNEETPRDDVH